MMLRSQVRGQRIKHFFFVSRLLVIGESRESVRGTKTNWRELRRKNGNKKVSTDGIERDFSLF